MTILYIIFTKFKQTHWELNSSKSSDALYSCHVVVLTHESWWYLIVCVLNLNSDSKFLV